MASSIIRLMLLGCGGVGGHLLHHIVSTRSLHQTQGVRVAVVAVADSKSILLREEIDDATLLRISSLKEQRNSLLSLGAQAIGSDPGATLASAVETLTDSTRSRLLIADCSASDSVGQILSSIAGLNVCMVLANKKPLTSSLEIHDSISSLGRRYRCESTVGAGLPVIATLNRLLNSGDPIKRIVGALSGTLGYVMSQLQEGKPFGSIVRRAKELGYTEPDPRDDLSGMDVARKALIMARLMGWRLSMEDVQVESLYSPELSPEAMSMEDFLNEGLSRLDLSIKKRVEAAASRGCVLRYVATVEKFQCKVGLVEQVSQTPLGQLTGSDNLIEIYSRCYSSSPLVIQGAGAGNDTTAAGVLADILDLQEYFTPHQQQ